MPAAAATSSSSTVGGRLLRAWLLTAVCDGLFSSLLTVLVYHSPLARLWQGVASTVLGPRAFDGDGGTVALGLLMHLGVALTWSTVFLLLVLRSAGVRRLLAAPGGVLLVAAVYGPLVWLVMSLAVIPLLTGRPPAFTSRWVIQLVGHALFVGLPIVASLGGGLRRAAEPAR